MPPVRLGIAIVFCAVFGAPSPSRSTPEERSPDPKPCTAVSATPSCAPDSTLATVGGMPIRAEDLDARAKEAAAGLDTELKTLKQKSLEDAIDSRLLELEGRRQHTSADHVYFTEVIEKMVAPTPAQLQAEYDRDPVWKTRGSLVEVQEWLSGKMQDSQEAGLYRSWCAGARERGRVRYVADLDGPGGWADTTLALVGRESIRASDVSLLYEPRKNAALRRLYEVQRSALEAAVRKRLLNAEAERSGTTPEQLVRTGIDEKTHSIGDAEIAAFFEGHRSEFEGDLAANRAEIAEYLEGQAREETENAFYDELAKAAGVKLSLPEPPTLTVLIRTKGSPSLGPASAPVTIVEFGDFECPPCGRAYGMLEEMRKTYGDRIRLVFRQYPLWMHPHARRAAEAALAAHAQGKFWPYADRLFHNQKALDDSSLRTYAAEVGLDRDLFDAALSARAYGSAVVRDVRDGRSYGAVGTPSFFVNGVALRSPAPESMRRAIEESLAKRASAPAPPRPRAGSISAPLASAFRPTYQGPS